MKALKQLLSDRAASLGATIILGLVLVAVFAPWIAPYPEDVTAFHLTERLQPPSAEHLFGTDRMGSDVFSRILFGARTTISIAVIAVGVSVVIGVPIGLVAGYYGGFGGGLLMRTSDVFLAVPQIVLAIAIAQTLGPSVENVILALSLTYWPFWARLVYAETNTLNQQTFVEAAKALGASDWRVMVLHILPNTASAIIVRTSIGMGATILTAAALGFLGWAPRRQRPNGDEPSRRRVNICPKRGGTPPPPASPSFLSSWGSTWWATGYATFLIRN